MNLLYVLSEFPPDFGGGISTVYGQLLPALVDQGHRVTVLLTDPIHCDQSNCLWKGVHVKPLLSSFYQAGSREMQGWKHHCFLYQFLPAAWAAWLQAAETEQPDLVEVTDWGLLFVPWLVNERRQPVVVSLHGSCGQVDWHGNPDGRQGEGALVRLLESAILPLADALIANSNLNADFWWRQCGLRAEVIPPLTASGGLAADPHPQVGSQRGVVVGRLQNWKGPELLCEAMRLLPNQHVDWIGQDTPWLERPLNSSSHLRESFPDVVDHRLHLMGKLPVDQVQARIASAAFLCVPSLWDVFNVTVLEAISSGTPVLCSTRAGAAMLLAHGKTGYLFDPRHPEELANAVRCVMGLSSAERRYLVAQAQAQIGRCTNPSLIGDQVQCLYKEVLDGFRTRELSPWLSDLLKTGAFASGAGGLHSHSRSPRSPLRRALGWASRGLKRVQFR